MKAGGEFETSLAQLSTIADTDKVSIEEFSGSIKELSSQTGAAASDLALVAYNAISAGTDTEKAMEMAKTATDLATGGFTNTDSALSVLTTSLNAYGDAAGTAAEISDSLIMVQNLGVTTVDQLSSSMGKAIATGSAYGVSLGNIESSYVSLTKQGINTAEATTYMSSMFKELGDSGSTVGKIIAEKTGKSFGQLMQEGMTTADIIGMLSESVDGNAEALMNLWGSAEAGKAANAIMNEGLEAFNENLKTIEGSSGATANAVAAMQDTFEYKADQMKQGAINLGIGLYEGFQDGAKGMLDVGNDYIKQLTDAFNEGGVDGLVEAVGSVLSDLVGRAAEFAPKVVELSVSLITSLVEGLQDNLDVIAEGAVSIITQLASAILELLPMLLDIGLQIILQLALGLGEALPELIPSIVEVILQMVETLTNPDNIGLLVDAACQIMIGLAEGLIKALPQLLIKAPEIIANVCQALVEAASQLGVAAFEMMVVIGKGLIESIPELISNIPEIVESIVETFDTLGSAFWDIGANIVTGIWNGLKNGWGDVVAWASEAAKNILNSVKDALGIHSPSKEFAKVGAYCSQGMIEGYDENDPVKAIGKSTSASMAAVEANTSYARYQNEVKSSDFEKFAGDLKTDTNVTVQIEADPDGIFRVVRKSEKEYYDRTGKGPFEHKK